MGYKHNPERHLNVEHDLYDETVYSKFILQPAVLRTAESDIKREIPTGAALVQDLFFIFYKHTANLKALQQVDPIFQLNRVLLLRIAGSAQWKQVHHQTKGDRVNAASAAASTIQSLIKHNQAVLTEMRRQIRQMRRVQQSINLIKKNILSNIQTLKKGKATLTPTQKTQIRNQIKTYHAKLKQNLKQRQQKNRNLRKMAQKLGYTSMIQLIQNILTFNENLFGWGEEEGFLQPKDPNETLKIQNMLLKKPNIIQIIQLAGRFHHLACLKQREKVYYVEEVADITLSNSLNRMIPSEVFNLILPELTPVFYSRFTGSTLLTYKLSGTDSRGEGPIVICTDISGSMAGENDTWAKAVAISLIRLAIQDNRDAMVIPFENDVATTFEFPHDDFKLSRLVEMAGYFTGGGTDFDPPLTYALDYIRSQERFTKADIIFITDGNGHLSEECRQDFETFKEETGCSLFSIIIGEEFTWISHALKSLSNVFLPVKKLTEEVAGDLFEAI